MNINLLCTIDNLLHEQDPDLYELTMLKLAYYRADMVHEIDQKYAQIAVKNCNAVLERKDYLIQFEAENTVKEAQNLLNKSK